MDCTWRCAVPACAYSHQTAPCDHLAHLLLKLLHREAPACQLRQRHRLGGCGGSRSRRVSEGQASPLKGAAYFTAAQKSSSAERIFAWPRPLYNAAHVHTAESLSHTAAPHAHRCSCAASGRRCRGPHSRGTAAGMRSTVAAVAVQSRRCRRGRHPPTTSRSRQASIANHSSSVQPHLALATPLQRRPVLLALRSAFIGQAGRMSRQQSWCSAARRAVVTKAAPSMHMRSAHCPRQQPGPRSPRPPSASPHSAWPAAVPPCPA